MKKGLAAMATVISLAMCTLSVSATNMTEEEPSGNMEVTASVSNSGDVTYTISIPDKIDFGTLHQPNSAASQVVAKEYSVQAVQINGLDKANSRVAVLLKDADSNGGFQLVGQSTANSGKKLNYFVYNNTGGAEADIMTGKKFPNGYLLAAFSEQGQAVPVKLKLDENQLYGLDLDEWAGSYKGIINFYSTIKSISDIN